jgi:CcmD family protein
MSNELLTVMSVTLITWLGIFIYLWRLNSRVSELESALRRKGKASQ